MKKFAWVFFLLPISCSVWGSHPHAVLLTSSKSNSGIPKWTLEAIFEADRSRVLQLAVNHSHALILHALQLGADHSHVYSGMCAALQQKLNVRYHSEQRPGNSHDHGLAFMVTVILHDNSNAAKATRKDERLCKYDCSATSNSWGQSLRRLRALNQSDKARSKHEQIQGAPRASQSIYWRVHSQPP
jgi:hypothetical protein